MDTKKVSLKKGPSHICVCFFSSVRAAAGVRTWKPGRCVNNLSTTMLTSQTQILIVDANQIHGSIQESNLSLRPCSRRAEKHGGSEVFTF